jgi:hypothetical protein
MIRLGPILASIPVVYTLLIPIGVAHPFSPPLPKEKTLPYAYWVPN